MLPNHCRIHHLRPQKKRRNYERITHITNNRINIKIQKKLERACWKDECRQVPPKDFKLSTQKRREV
jgi:hypothetical protein